MRIYRPAIHLPRPTDKKHMELMRDVLEGSRKLLEQPVPDTFLGRNSKEPVPSKKNAEDNNFLIAAEWIGPWPN